MRIGIDIRPLLDKNFSGIPEYTYNLVQEIVKTDKNNEYKFFYNRYFEIEQDSILDFLKDQKIVNFAYPNKIFNLLQQKILKHPCLDQALDVDLFFMPHVNFAAFSRDVELIVTIHDLSFLRNSSFFSFKKNLWHFLVGIKNILKRADKIIAVSENTKKDILNYFDVDSGKIHVIYSGISDNFFNFKFNQEKINNIKNKYSLPDKYILYLGTIEPRKNVISIIEAYQHLRKFNKINKDYKLLLVGGNGWKSGDIYSAQQKSEFRDDIIFVGRIESGEREVFYSLANIFVYPSFYEGFGLPPVESQACGVPVITGNSSGMTEVVGNSGICIDPYNVGDLAKAIEILTNSASIRNLYINKGTNNAAKYNWSTAAKKYIDIFQS